MLHKNFCSVTVFILQIAIWTFFSVTIFLFIQPRIYRKHCKNKFAIFFIKRSVYTNFIESNALSICSDKIIFVQDKMKIVLDKIIFVQDKKFCPKLKSHFSYNSSLMMNFLSMYKIFCSGQKIFCLRQFWFCPGQKSFCLDRWIGHKYSFVIFKIYTISKFSCTVHCTEQ